jgi:PAS domain S-box-containing protein
VGGGNTKKVRILIVEDEAIVAEDLEMAITDIGYEVVGRAVSADEAVKKAVELKPDLIVMDIVLRGEKNGIDASHEIKEKMGIPIIFLTAYSDIELIDKAKSTEPHAYILKPFQERQLLASIEIALYKSRMEKRLKESEEFSSSLLINSPNPILVINPDTSVRYVNPALKMLTGFSSAELVGKKAPYPWWMEETLEKTRRDLEEAMRKGATNLEEFFQRKNSERFWVEITSTPVKSKGEFEYYLSNWVDVTGRKRAEEALRESHEKLKELDKMKTDFLNVAYHEMLTPLTPIVGYTNLLEQSELTEKQKNYVRIIEESASQLNELIGSLLEVARLGAGKIDLTVQEVSIPEIVKEVLEHVKPLVDAKKQTISTVVPDGIEVEGDKQKITAIFENLILNAIKFTGENGRIDIVVEDRKEEGDIRVCVADTGDGISEENLPRIFERFYMLDTSLTRKGGLGLGLALVKGYVGLHGGEVWATSELGKGSKFCFILPKKRR